MRRQHAAHARLLLLIAGASGFRFDRPDWATIEACGVVASAREGDRLFSIAVACGDAFGCPGHEADPAHDDAFRPFVADLAGVGPLHPARVATAEAEFPVATMRSMHSFPGSLVAVESGVFNARDLADSGIIDEPGWAIRWVGASPTTTGSTSWTMPPPWSG